MTDGLANEIELGLECDARMRRARRIGYQPSGNGPRHVAVEPDALLRFSRGQMGSVLLSMAPPRHSYLISGSSCRADRCQISAHPGATGRTDRTSARGELSGSHGISSPWSCSGCSGLSLLSRMSPVRTCQKRRVEPPSLRRAGPRHASLRPGDRGRDRRDFLSSVCQTGTDANFSRQSPSPSPGDPRSFQTLSPHRHDVRQKTSAWHRHCFVCAGFRQFE